MLYNVSFYLILYLIVGYTLIPNPYLTPPPSFSPLITSNFFSVSLCLFYFIFSSLLYILVLHVSVDLLFSVWFISLSIIPSKSTQVMENGKFSFFLTLSSILFYTHIYTHMSHLLYPFICWWTLRLLSYLSYCNNVALDIGLPISFQISAFIFSDTYPEVELLGHMVVLFLVFWEISILFSTAAASIYIPTNSGQTTSPTFWSPWNHPTMMGKVPLLYSIFQRRKTDPLRG